MNESFGLFFTEDYNILMLTIKHIYFKIIFVQEYYFLLDIINYNRTNKLYMKKI